MRRLPAMIGKKVERKAHALRGELYRSLVLEAAEQEFAEHGFADARVQRVADNVLEAGVDIDMLDNFLIKIGVGMVNERLMPKPAALDEIKAYSGAVQAAFAKDFKHFERHAATASK
jgi:hypothetical protein